MLRLSVLAFLATFLAALNATTASAQGAKDHVIFLFGARWCAPCMVEYKDLPNLVRAAAPEHITLAWVDRSIAPPADLASDVTGISVEKARQIASEVAGVGYGLPFSAMFDADGHACAIWRHPLAPAGIEQLRLTCRTDMKPSR